MKEEHLADLWDVRLYIKGSSIAPVFPGYEGCTGTCVITKHLLYAFKIKS
jgi:hypothetical protein